MKHTDFMALAGKMWGEEGAEAKEGFQQQADEARARFVKELAEWKEKGYYTLPDGTKSKPAANRSDLEGLSDEEEASLADEDSKPRRAVGKGRAEMMAKQALASAKGSRAGSRPASKIAPRAPSRSPSKPASKVASASNTPRQSKTRRSAQRVSEGGPQERTRSRPASK